MDLFELFMPHGHCFMWAPDIVASRWIGTLTTAGAYLFFPFAWSLALDRVGIKPQLKDWLLSSFVCVCGIGHVLGLVSVYVGAHRLYAYWEVLTGIVSVAFAVDLLLWVSDVNPRRGAEDD